MAVTAENGSGGARRKKAPAKKEIRHDLPALSDIPAFFPAPGVGRLALSNPVVAGVLLGYTIAEKTQQFWGPGVQAHADATRQDWDNFMSQFSQFQETGPATVGRGRAPSSQINGAVQAAKPKRKVSKANKAFKKAYAVVSRGFKGKMTRKKCEYFMRKASKMASKANPHTKSRIGKAKNATTKHCRKIRKGVWGVTKHA